MTAEIPKDARPTILADATCTCCGCICDDIELVVEGNRILQAKHACALGQAWFQPCEHDDHPGCLIEGEPASIGEGVERAAQILREARYPLVYGLEQTTTEAQRVAVSIADWIGGAVDTTTSVRSGPTGSSFHGVAEATCTLGEIANRSDLVLFWGCNPAQSHPRHFERYSLNPAGMFLPPGRQDRIAVMVNDCRNESCEAMDEFLQLKPGADFEALWVLRGLVQGLALDAEQVLRATSIELACWQQLATRMKSARYGAIVFGAGLSQSHGRHVVIDALQSLMKDLNAHTRFVANPLRDSNQAGADQVVTWQTGYPFGVNLTRGYPRFSPEEYSADAVLSRGEADAALVVASDPLSDLSEKAIQHLKAIPSIVCDFKPTETMRAATVAFLTAIYGIQAPGTVYRMDGVPIPLRAVITSRQPTDFDLLVLLEKRVKALPRQR